MSKELIKADAGRYDVQVARDAAQLWQEELGPEFTPTFPRLKVPAGGGTSWDDPFSPDPESPDQAKDFTGIIVGKRKVSRLYLTNFDDRDAEDSGRPDAWSIDGKTQIVPQATVDKIKTLNADREANGIAPLPVPSRQIANCPYSQFGSAGLLGKAGKGKATNDYLELYLYADGKPLPVLLAVPAGSIANATKHLQAIVQLGKPLSAVETVVALKKAKSGQGITFSEVTFAIGAPLEPSLAQSLKGYELELKPILEADPFAQAQAEGSADDGAIEGTAYDGGGESITDAGTSAVAAGFDAEPVAAAAGDIQL